MGLILGTYDPNEYFIVTTENILEPLGVKVTKVKDDLIPTTRDNTEQIPGLDGEYDFGTEFGPRLIELEVCSPDGLNPLQKEEFKRLYAKYLNPRMGTKKLIFMNDPDVYYKVKYSGSIPSNNYPSWFSFTIPFKATDPFKYSTTQKSHSGVGVLTNNGADETGLIIEIEGPVHSITINFGDIVLSFGGEIDAGEKLIVDTWAKTAKIGNENFLYMWDGFPLLPVGDTVISSISLSRLEGAPQQPVTFKWTERYL